MPQAEAARRLWRRADTRAVVGVGLALVLALSAQASFLYVFAAEESLEQADHWLGQARQLVLSLDPLDISDDALLRAAHAALPGGMRAVRVVLGADVRGGIGDWPEPSRLVPVRRDDTPNRGLRSFLLLRADAFLADSIELSGGRRIELAMPMKRFAGETREIGRLLALLVLLSSIAAFGVAFVATRRAFAPLHAGTALLERIDAAHLEARLPTRATGDPVDQHAGALNAVLANIEVAFERMRAFASDVAHELRTPLNRIRNLADVALTGDDAQALTGALERIQHSTDELGRMVDTLLLLGEVDDGRVLLKREHVDVDAWLRGTIESWAPAFEEHGARLTLRATAGTLEADRALLDRVLSNLLDNAVSYGAAGGRVELSAVGDEHDVVIALDDAGPGVPTQERERVFERFVRLDRSWRGSTGGLGLALARSVARLLGGELELSTSQLGGARFVWRVPRRAPAGGSEAAAGDDAS